MEKKNILVTFTCPAEDRQALMAAAEGCDVQFREPDWSRERYIEALKSAHIIIGEPRNEEFIHCENLQLMHSPSSGVNY